MKSLLFCLVLYSLTASNYALACSEHELSKSALDQMLDDIVAGNYQGHIGPIFKKPKESVMRNLVWRVSHVDDMLFGVTIGMGSWALGLNKRAYKDIRDLADGKEVKKIHTWRGDVKRKYVFFSDHHYLGFAKKHDYFRTWEQNTSASNKIESLDIYKHALNNYNDKEYTLVELGDVEDLVTIEPTLKGAAIDQLFDFFAMPLGEIFDEKFEDKNKQIQLLDIFYNYWDLYDQVGKTFVANDRFVKVLGNHDAALKKPKFLKMLRKMYHKDIDVYDYAIIEGPNPDGSSKYAKFISAHGHQFDPWTNPRIAKLVGEAFTQSEAWFGNGADRIWPKSEGGSGGWKAFMNKEVGFDNRLALAPSMKKEKGEMAKFRHMGEMNIERRMNKTFQGAPQIPTLILGHTHEPKIGALAKNGKQFNGYVNTGATGHYEQLIWCVEVVDGTASVWAWYVDNHGKIIKQKMQATKDGRLIPEA